MIQTSTQIKLTCGCGKGRARRTLTAQEVQKILAYSEAGKSRKTIARLMHIKRRVMLRELSKAGITLPKRCGCFQSRHLSWFEIGEALRMRQKRKTVKEIASSLRITRKVLRRELKAAGIEFEPFNRRLTLCDAEVSEFKTLRRRGWNLEAIAEMLCVTKDVLTREMHARGISTAAVRKAKRVKPRGFWGRMGDDPDAVKIAV